MRERERERQERREGEGEGEEGDWALIRGYIETVVSLDL